MEGDIYEDAEAAQAPSPQSGAITTGVDPNFQPIGAGEEEQPPPEEQAQYDQFVTRALQFINGPKTLDVVLKSMNEGSRPVYENVGRQAARIAHNIVQTAERAGTKISPDVIFHGGQEIVAELLEVGEEAGIFDVPEDKEQNELEMAFMSAVEHYGRMLKERGEAPIEEAKAAMDGQLDYEARTMQQDPRAQSATVRDAVHKAMRGG